MSKLLGIVTLMMAVCLPFCSGTLVGDATLYLEVWRSVWRFTDDSYTNGSFVNKFYHCIGTPIAENVILTSAKCLQRLSYTAPLESVYLYGNYNQTTTIINRNPAIFVQFLDNELQLTDRFTPMIFNIRDVIYSGSKDSSGSPVSDLAFLVLKDSVYLNKGVKFAKLLDDSNSSNRNYSNCLLVAVNRNNNKRQVSATCSVRTDAINHTHLDCHIHGNPNGTRVLFDAGSPVFCAENNSDDFFQVGFVSKYPYLHPPIMFANPPMFQYVRRVNVPLII